MDPSQRKLLAVASAPQQAQFGMLQHYRQRFQAMNSFARVAADGTQGRPANLAASTDAATRAYHNVPNGQSISFHPAGPGHVAMTVSHYAGDKGASKKVTAHAAGGAVPDDVDPMDVGPEGAVSSGEPNDLGQTMDTATAQVGAIPADTSILGNGMGEAETAATPKVALLSTSQYLNMLKNGHFDQMMDDAEKAITDAQKTPSQAASAGATAVNAGPPPIAGGDVAPGEAPMPQSDPRNVVPANAGNGAPGAPGANAGNGAPAPSAADQASVSPYGTNPNEISVLPENPTQGQIAAFNQSNGGVGRATNPQVVNPFGGSGLSPQERLEVMMNAPANARGAPFQFGTGKQTIQTQGMKDLWGTKENAIDSRSAAAIAGRQTVAGMNAAARIQAAQIRAAQMAWSSGNASVSGVAKSIMAQIPGTLPKDAYQQALNAMPQAGAIVQGGPQQQSQPAQQEAPAAAQPITGPIAVNPQTGQRMTVRNGAWVPLP